MSHDGSFKCGLDRESWLAFLPNVPASTYIFIYISFVHFFPEKRSFTSLRKKTHSGNDCLKTISEPSPVLMKISPLLYTWRCYKDYCLFLFRNWVNVIVFTVHTIQRIGSFKEKRLFQLVYLITFQVRVICYLSQPEAPTYPKVLSPFLQILFQPDGHKKSSLYVFNAIAIS